jgi:AcrR family transcriptional regulator
LLKHFENKEGLLRAVLDHWERENSSFFEGAHGLAYFRRLPSLIMLHRIQLGRIEPFLTLATEATNPSHPARNWAVEHYKRAITTGISYLREACDMDEVLPMNDYQLEVEARNIYAVMVGAQLQWLLEPSVNPSAIFETQLDASIDRWTGRDRARARKVLPADQSTPAAARRRGPAV